MTEKLDFIIAARDDASSAVQKITGQTISLKNVLLGLGTAGGGFGLIATAAIAAGGAIVASGRQIADAAESLDLVSNRAGVSGTKIQVWRQIIREGGGDAEALDQALVYLSRRIGAGDPLLAKLGITTKDTGQAFEQLSDILGRSADTEKRNEIAFQLLGRAGGALAGQLRDIASGSAEMEAALRQSGNLLEGDALDAARQLDAQFDALGRNWTGTLTRIQKATVPWALGMVSAFNDVWDAISGNKANTLAEVEQKIASIEQRIAARGKSLADAQRRATQVAQSPLPKLFNGPAEEARQMQQEIAEMQRQLAALNQQRKDLGGGEKFGTFEEAANRVKLLEKQIEDLDDTLNTLRATGDDIELIGDPEKIQANLRKLREQLVEAKAARDSFRGGAEDPLANVNLTTTTTSPREKQLEKIRELLDVSTAAAERYQQRLTKIDEQGARSKLFEDLKASGIDALGEALERNLREAQRRLTGAGFKIAILPEVQEPTVPADIVTNVKDAIGPIELEPKVVLPKLELPPLQDPLPGGDDESFKKTRDEILASLPQLDAEFTRVVANWTTLLDDLTSAAGVVDLAIGGTFSSLQGSLETVAVNLRNESQTIKSAVLTVLDSMVDEALRILARLAAASFLKFIVGLVFGGPINLGIGGVSLPEVTSSAAPGLTEAHTEPPAPASVTVDASSLVQAAAALEQSAAALRVKPDPPRAAAAVAVPEPPRTPAPVLVTVEAPEPPVIPAPIVSVAAPPAPEIQLEPVTVDASSMDDAAAALERAAGGLRVPELPAPAPVSVSVEAAPPAQIRIEPVTVDASGLDDAAAALGRAAGALRVPKLPEIPAPVVSVLAAPAPEIRIEPVRVDASSLVDAAAALEQSAAGLRVKAAPAAVRPAPAPRTPAPALPTLDPIRRLLAAVSGVLRGPQRPAPVIVRSEPRPPARDPLPGLGGILEGVRRLVRPVRVSETPVRPAARVPEKLDGVDRLDDSLKVAADRLEARVPDRPAAPLRVPAPAPAAPRASSQSAGDRRLLETAAARIRIPVLDGLATVRRNLARTFDELPAPPPAAAPALDSSFSPGPSRFFPDRGSLSTVMATAIAGALDRQVSRGRLEDRRGGRGDTYNIAISTIEGKTILDQTISPRGSLRSANQREAEIRLAYGGTT